MEFVRIGTVANVLGVGRFEVEDNIKRLKIIPHRTISGTPFLDKNQTDKIISYFKKNGLSKSDSKILWTEEDTE